MLKPQDSVLLLKLLANQDKKWSQRSLADTLCISLAEVNGGLKRLTEAKLLRKQNDTQFVPIIAASLEFLTTGLKYLIPAKKGTLTRGIPTTIRAPIFENKIAANDEPIYVWPDAQGKEQGMALDPIHSSVTKSLQKVPDESFYELLALLDSIRTGRPREKNMAIKLLTERIEHGH